MSSLACLLVLATVVTMATAQGGYGQIIPIVRDDRTQNPYGESRFEFEAGNGIVRYETGSEKDGHVQEGGWRYQSPEGIPVEITFVADQGGYQPQGDLLPVPPPLPYERTQNFGGGGGYA
ncbi:cuticle protein AMP1B-like [Penaeus chinensis]|uniref:cuticle protein AMP1B-like n=1 Tax=Penaeus chinensis TaxID=139456 RepID=UPI001FB59474|nr:cuticle protein AMP1B-like [Penaeus chinensis]